MDPVSALGLVWNVLQLADAARKAYNVYREIYKPGASFEDSRMTYTSDELYKCSSDLSNSLNSKTSCGSQVLPSHIDLNDLSSQCCETARALHNELLSLRKKLGGGVCESLSKFVMKRTKAKDNERLKSRLDEHQKVLDKKVLMDVRHVYSDPGTTLP